MFRRLKIMVGAMVLATNGLAQEPSPPGRQTLESLEQQVRELRQQVKVLELRLDATSASAATASPEIEPVVATEASPKEDHGIQIRGFGEVKYKALNQRIPELGAGGFVPGSAANFYTGDFDLLLTAAISDKARVLSESNFEETDTQKFKVNLERLLLIYDLNDRLRLSVGRYQTGIGYYNTVFHNGGWLQTSVDR